MAIINEQKRSIPPFPDPRDTDQSRINRQVVDAIRYLLSRFDQSNIEQRLHELEEKVSSHDDVING